MMESQWGFVKKKIPHTLEFRRPFCIIDETDILLSNVTTFVERFFLFISLLDFTATDASARFQRKKSGKEEDNVFCYAGKQSVETYEKFVDVTSSRQRGHFCDISR